MKNQTPYVKLLHLILFFFFLTFTNTLLSQSTYEGFGANAVGGANSTTVYRVTNLNSSGAGSLANGIGSNRTIVFDVSGTIIGRFDLIGISYLTIDATGRDITINGNNNGDAISFDGSNTHHCILKGVHVTNAGNDGINVLDGAHDIVITNCTSYGNRDGNIDVAGDAVNVTVQYCILGGGASGWAGDMLITSTNVSVHHNLFSPATAGQVGERCPFVHSNYSSVGSPNADIRNNVIWRYGRSGGTGSGYGTAIAYNATGNVVNNYYYTTGTSPGSAVNSDDGYGSGATGKVYASGNVSGNTGQNPNTASNHAIYTIPAQYAVTTQDACTAASLVLANAGPSPRNATDLALITGVTLPNCSTAPVNQAPAANAGNNITLTLPTNSTSLAGSGTDADGTIASYAWTRVSGPTTFTLGTANAATTTLTGLVQGTYVFRLTVTDDDGATGTDDVTVTVNAAPNLAPTANAGNDITLTLPTNSTSLAGSGTDADGTIASYAWTRVSGPTTFTLGTANAATTTLTALVQGTYVFRLTVTDNGGATATDNVTVIVNAAPQAPTANAGSDIILTLPVNSTTLTGSGTDPDGTIASYAWARVSGPTTFTLGTANAATTTLTGLVQGTYVFRLTVTDNSGMTGTDNITVTVNPAANVAPSANAGNNITITLPVNSTTLNGSGTDTDGTIAGYAWTRVSGPTTFTLGTANAATSTLTGLVQGTYVFRLTVTDNSGATGTDDVTVTVNAAANQLPTANAGNNIVITLPVNSTTLNGSGTDADGTITGYAWTRVSGPTTFTFGTANAAITTLTGLVQGTYVFRLTVTDNSGATATDDVNVTVNAAVNQLPTANAGNNIVITLPVNSTTLAGSGTDPDGTITGYVWTHVSGPATYTLGTANAASTTLTGLVQGTYVFRLTVTDNSGATATDDVSVTVNAAPPTNQAPVANAGSNIVITLPINSTTLNGSGTDADGTITGYAWTRVSGPATYILGTANAASTTLTGLVQGTYVFRLTVTDNSGATATDDVNVTVNAAAPTNQAPIANAGTNITISLPVNSTSLNGSGSIDLDGTIATYAWSWVSGPATYTFGTANAAATTLTGLVQGTYVFRLTVTDNGGATDIDNIVVTVNAAANQVPSANAGNNIVITLPTNSTTLTGSGADIDGTISSYAWSRVSGPTTFTIGTPNAATTTLSNLVQGTYVFRLTVTDNNGATATDDITVTVNPAPIPNQPPVARAGNDIVMTLPVNSTTLNGNTSTDADGTIVSYSWSRISGPATFNFTSAGSAATGVNNLVQGAYVFRLTVTDDDGASATDDISVTVNAAANQAPVANAGNDITITLPVNSTTLNGSGTDADGTITGYAWSRVSGPATFTLGNANAATTTLTNLVQGVYVFRLTVTDNSGATGVDNVTIVVNAANPPANLAPAANAGNDITITLPVNSTTLTGSGTDPDGTIVAYNWTRVSGPTTFLVANGSAASTSLTNLVQGVYVFRITVTDNYGATASDNVTVTVNAAVPGANQPPVARTSADSIVLTLPVNSTSLSGTGSTDADGIITGYEWIQVSGPNQATINSGLTANSQVSNLTIGVYTFQLKVTDDDGASAFKTMKVIVKNKSDGGTYFNLYPNPTQGGLTLQYFANGNGKYRISVYDATRRLVKDGFVDKTQVTLTETMDVSNLKNGVYIIQIVLPDGKTAAKQFIKM